MVKKKLVERLIADGAELLRELDRQGFPVESMFWVLLPDEEYWRLVIGSPFVGEYGGTAGYRRLNELLRPLSLIGISLEDTSLLDPESTQFLSFYSLARQSSGLAAGPEWFELEDAVVYRWKSASLKGELTCDVSAEDLQMLWERERLPGSHPVLLISKIGSRVTLRFHPKHGPQERIDDSVKTAFQIALHKSRRDCDLRWLG